jgi:hypothetical protein
MASQYLTIAKIGGRSAENTARLFDQWARARLVNIPNEWHSEQWPKDVRQQVDRWVDALREHAHRPPILFFVEYVDLWSFSPPQRYLSDYGLVQIMTDRYEVYCLRLPFAAEAKKELERIRRDGQHDEDRWFGTITLSAAAAWDALVDVAVLIFLRRIVDSSVRDKEVEDSLKIAAPWTFEA